jgi:hypothetical protein
MITTPTIHTDTSSPNGHVRAVVEVPWTVHVRRDRHLHGRQHDQPREHARWPQWRRPPQPCCGGPCDGGRGRQTAPRHSTLDERGAESLRRATPHTERSIPALCGLSSRMRHFWQFWQQPVVNERNEATTWT